MKKEYVFAFAAFFFMSLSAFTAVYALEETNKFITITSKQMDVTGDSKKDMIQLKGEPYDKENGYMKNLSLEVLTANDKTFHIDLEGGIEPTINFSDLNHDGVKDVFVTIPTGGSGGISNHYLYSFKDLVKTNLTVPKPLLINGQFVNGYKAKILIEATKETIIFDLIERKESYDQIGLYQNGKLNEPTELMVNQYGALTPILTKGEKLGLKGVQRISGAANADSIANVESIWFYDDGGWKLTGTKIKPIHN
jgi:hypothetical protein